MRYDFKLGQELLWAAVAAVVTVVLTALYELDAEAVTNWQTWGTGVGIAAIRSAAGAALAILGRGALSK